MRVPNWHEKVPKDPEENLAYRAMIRKWARNSVANQQELINRCKQDTLYFFNSFLWLFEPRDETNPIIPFITWPHQDKMIQGCEPQLGKRDIGIEKARGEGASWCFLGMLIKKWLWNPWYAVGLVSRNELAVDNALDPDSLMYKLDFTLEMLPKWMVPKFDRNKTKHTLVNLENKSSIVGYSSTGDLGSGGRKTVFLFDELSKFAAGNDYAAVAAVQQTTKCRIFIATPNGPRGQYYDIMHDEKSSLLKVILDWQENPTRNKGLYRSRAGILEILDRQYEFPPDYEFVLDGWTRSPWFDAECKRPGATRRNIMQELMRHYGGSDDPYFDPELLLQLQEFCRPPLHRGRLRFDSDDLTPHWEEREDGKLLLWRPLDPYGNPPFGYYTVGCDVARGTGGDYSSNSVAFVLDTKTGEQVAEFAVNDTSFPPDVFCEWTIALCKWFHGAFLNFERNGPGQEFAAKLLDNGYPNYFQQETKDTEIRKKIKKPGFWSQANDRADLLGGQIRGGGFEEGVRKRELCIRSADLLKECGHFIYDNGKVVHRRSLEAQDQGSRGVAHGDRVIAAAIAWIARTERPAPKVEIDHTCPPGSFGWRREQDRKAKASGRWVL